MTTTDDTAKWDYEPPKVSWEPTVVDGRVTGYHIEPKFGLTWPHIQTLQHRAALIEHRTGIRLRVVTSDHDEELFEIGTPHGVIGSEPYRGVSLWLTAFEEGVREARRVDKIGESPRPDEGD